MKRLLTILLLAAISAVPVIPAQAQQPNPLTTRILEAQALSSLDDPTLKPWHLKLAVQLYDFKGAPTEQGTIEEWWAAPNQHKVTYTFPSSQVTVLETPAGRFRTRDAKRTPFQADDILNLVVHPISYRNVFEQAIPALQKQSFGKIVLDCMHFTAPPGHPIPIPPTTSFCLTPDTSVLRLISTADTRFILRNVIGKFQGKQVATDVAFNYGTVKNSSGQVTTLATLVNPDPALFSATPDLAESPRPVMPLNSSVVAGRKIGGEQPVYPIAAKVQHLSGTVLLHALVSREGRITDLVPVYASDPAFVPSALQAVATWTYQPYLVNGQPTEVDTTITINFNMGR